MILLSTFPPPSLLITLAFFPEHSGTNAYTFFYITFSFILIFIRDFLLQTNISFSSRSFFYFFIFHPFSLYCSLRSISFCSSFVKTFSFRKFLSLFPHTIFIDLFFLYPLSLFYSQLSRFLLSISTFSSRLTFLYATPKHNSFDSTKESHKKLPSSNLSLSHLPSLFHISTNFL